MSMNPLNDISAVYMQEVFKPQLGKQAAKPAKPEAKGDDSEKSGGSTDPSASSEKRIRQAVYDIRYRARREEVPVAQAYNQYMAHTTMTGPEKSAVKSKLGESYDINEVEEKKYKVRVTDKTSGKTYVRYATRQKIAQLRSNPNISSVEMTGYGSPYEGEKSKGEYTAKAKSGKGLDPVGKEDKDIDNDGDHDKTDKYLLNRRKVRGAAIEKRDVKEGFSNWRNDLREVIDVEDKTESSKQIKEKKVNNKIIINPDMKESIEDIGGQILEFCEINDVLDYVADSELVLLSDDLIEEIVHEVFDEYLDEGYSISEIEDVLSESLEFSLALNESVLMEMNPYAPAGSKEAQAYNKATTSSKRSAQRAAKRKEIVGKVKSAVSKVGEKLKSAVKTAKEAGKKGVKAAATNVGKAGAKTVSAAKKVGAAVKAGYESAKDDDDSGERKPKPYRYAGGKKSTLLSRVASGLKKGLKTAVGKTARMVSKGADKLASKLGEEVLSEKITAKTDMGAAIKDFYSSKSPQLAGRTKEERRKAAIAAVLTARRGGKKLGEAVSQVPGRETTPPEGTTAKQDDVQRKQMLANKQKMMQKQQMLQRQQLQLQKQGKLAMNYGEEVEFEIEEMTDLQRRRYLGRKPGESEERLKRSNERKDKKAALASMMKQYKGMKSGIYSSYEPEGELVDEGMTMKDFKANRQKNKRREASADAEKRGHVGKEWHNTGRKYSPDEAKSRRSNMSDDDRAARHRVAVDPDDDRDENTYSADKTKNPKKQRKQAAMGEATLHERTRYAKETGKDPQTGKPSEKGGTLGGDDIHSKVMRHMKQNLRQTGGLMSSRGKAIQPQGKKKVPGKKPPVAGQYGAPQSPAQKVAAKRAAAKRAQDNLSSRFD